MAATKNFDRVISADSHVMEPFDMWWNAIGHKYGDRTPRVLEEYQGERRNFFYTGYQGGPISRINELNPVSEAAAFEAQEKGLGAVGYDPAVRVKFQEEAGVSAEVMNSTRMLAILRNPDVEILQACAEVFNDWEAEFCSYNPKRLIGVSVIPMYDIDWATKELARTLKKGLRGPMINCQPPEGALPYRRKEYDRFWAIANEAGIPLTLHLLTGQALDPIPLAGLQTEEEAEVNPGMWIDLFNEIQGVLANDFIFGGIMDRFPNLRLICSEYEMSWIPGFLSRLDQIEDVALRIRVGKLPMRASDYMRTRVYHGLIDDVYGGEMVPIVGTDRVLWGSDFPHLRSIGLDAQETLTEMFKDLPRKEQEKIVGGNAVEAFNLN